MISQSFETLPPATFTVMGSSLCSSYKCEWQSSSTRPFKTCSSTTTSDGSGKNTKEPNHRNVVRILEVYHSIGFKPTFQVIYLAKNQISGTSGSITTWLCYNIPILHIALRTTNFLSKWDGTATVGLGVLLKWSGLKVFKKFGFTKKIF